MKELGVEFLIIDLDNEIVVEFVDFVEKMCKNFFVFMVIVFGMVKCVELE